MRMPPPSGFSGQRYRATHAQFNLGCSYEKGEGIDKDREKSLYWYGKAARQGDADAQARLDAF